MNKSKCELCVTAHSTEHYSKFGHSDLSNWRRLSQSGSQLGDFSDKNSDKKYPKTLEYEELTL